MATLGKGVLARYGNCFHEDDDFFTHCLILNNGECWLLGQGPEPGFRSRLQSTRGQVSPIEGCVALDTSRMGRLELRHKRI